MIALIDSLRLTPPFSCLNDASLGTLETTAQFQALEHGETYVHQGDVCSDVLLIRSGTLLTKKISLKGRALTPFSLGTGDVFWGLGFFLEDLPMPASLEARGKVCLAAWYKEDILPILLEHPQGLWSLCQTMVNRLVRASEILEDFAFHPVSSRLAGFLLDEYGESEGNMIARDLTLNEIADHIGSSPEVVSRLLYRFSDQDFIHITRTEFSIEDKEGLSRFAGLRRS